MGAAVPENDLDGLEQRALALLLIVLFLAALGIGALLAWATHAWAPGITTSLAEPAPRGFWYLSRASGVVAFALVWYSMALGLLITNRLSRFWPGGPTAFDMHQHVSLLGLGFSIFHMVVLLGDPKIHFRLALLLVPFGGIAYRPAWVAAGQLALYLMLLVTISFYVRRWVGKRAWRVIHSASFLLFVFVLMHGVLTGPDSNELWARGMYWFSGASILCLTLYRVLLSLRPGHRRRVSVSSNLHADRRAHPR